MAVQPYHGDSIVILSAAADEYTDEASGRFTVESVIVDGGTAGLFTVDIGEAPLNIRTTTAQLTKQIFINRTVKSVTLSALPTGGILQILLRKGVR